MHSTTTKVGASVAGVLCSFGLVALVQASPAAAAASAADKTFVTGNEQVNLAEITIGKIALQRASSQSIRDLATKTIADHQAAQTKLTAVAKAQGVTLPTAPNAQQQSQAATLKSVAAASFDVTYAQIQVAGHEMSIAATNTEISTGSDPSVTSYAKGYLPVAQMHLTMAQDDLATLGGTPTGAPAGTGGFASASDGHSTVPALGLGVGGVTLIIAAGALGLNRRKARHAG